MLLCLSQQELAALSAVGVATIRRFETGHGIGLTQVELLQGAIEAAGIILLKGQSIAGRPVGDGVALADERDLPPETVERTARRDRPEPADSERKRGRPLKRRPQVIGTDVG